MAIDWFLKQLVGFATSEIKHQARGALRDKKKKYTMTSAAKDVEAKLGFATDFYTIKSGEIVFKSNPIFCHQWLTSSPLVKDKIIRDEETGKYFYNNMVLNDSDKSLLLSKFREITKIESPSLLSHFNQALNLLSPIDITSELFINNHSKWDKKKRLDIFLSRCFPDGIYDLEFSNILFRKWIIGAAKRIISPGISHDGCLTLKGGPGLGKTQFFRKLMPEPFENRTGEINCDIRSSQKFVESIIGKSIACFDELAGLNESVIEEFKRLLSQQHIDVRLAWRRDPQRYLLRQGFCATTNKDKFILDAALKRRLWVIELNGKTRLDFDYLNENKKELWSEAVYYAFKDKESHFLSLDEQRVLEDHNQKYLFN